MGFKTQVVAISEIKGGTARFNNIGKDGIYYCELSASRSEKTYTQAFLVDTSGNVVPIIPNLSNCDTLLLYRKYHKYVKTTNGAVIQGSNSKKFINSETLYTMPISVVELKKNTVKPKRGYRYYRYYAPIGADDIKISMIKLFYDDNGKNRLLKTDKIYGHIKGKLPCYGADIKNAFDGNIRTNFNAMNGSWVAVDAGKPVKLTVVSVMPRSSFNIVEPGHLYELFYFDKGNWVSLGRKMADDNHVIYDNAPSGALYLLRNRTMGVEERRFMYINGKQVWQRFLE